MKYSEHSLFILLQDIKLRHQRKVQFSIKDISYVAYALLSASVVHVATLSFIGVPAQLRMDEGDLACLTEYHAIH